MEEKSICFPEVAFPKDFRKSVMLGKKNYKKYDLNYLMKHGFVIVYTIVNSNDKSHQEIVSNIQQIIRQNSGKTIIADMGNKEPIKFFDDIIFSWYELIKGTRQMSIFPLEILFLITSISHIFSDDEEAGHIYGETYTLEGDWGRIDMILFSNKKGLVKEPVGRTIIESHRHNLREIIDKQEKKKQNKIINKGVLIQGDSNVVSNVNIANGKFFPIIYNLIEKKNPKNKEEVIEAVKEIEKKGEKSSKFNFLKENVPWILPLLDAVLKIKGALGQ